MPERPLLLFGTPVRAKREKGEPSFRPSPHFPARGRQIKRLHPTFERWRNIIKSRNPELELKSDPSCIAPDRALVFEVTSSLDDFTRLAQNLGIPFLGEVETDFAQDDFFYIPNKAKEKIRGTLYLVMPDMRSLNLLLSIWRWYEKDNELQYVTPRWRALFRQLRKIRPWGPEDRITDSFHQALTLWMESETSEPFRFEIDLWYSESPRKRAETRQTVLKLLRSGWKVKQANHFGRLKLIFGIPSPRENALRHVKQSLTPWHNSEEGY